MSALSDYLNQANAYHLSTYEIARLATHAGYRTSQSTVSRYMNGEHPIPASRRVLTGLSIALNTPLEKLIELAGQTAQYSEFRLPPEADALNDKQRAAIINLIHTMIPEPQEKTTQTPEKELTPDGYEFNPAQYADHKLLWERYGTSWKEHYGELAAKRQTPDDDIEEPH